MPSADEKAGGRTARVLGRSTAARRQHLPPAQPRSNGLASPIEVAPALLLVSDAIRTRTTRQYHATRESALGLATHSRRIAQAWLRSLAADCRPSHAASPEAAFADLAHVPPRHTFVVVCAATSATTTGRILTSPSRRMRPSRAPLSHPSRVGSLRCPRSADSIIATSAARRRRGTQDPAVTSRGGRNRDPCSPDGSRHSPLRLLRRATSKRVRPRRRRSGNSSVDQALDRVLTNDRSKGE